MPFLSAVIMPALAGGAFVSSYMASGSAAFGFNMLYFLLTLTGLMLLHLGSNVMNDYFDVKDGTDGANNDYFMQYSGGSRAVELRLITLEGTQKLGMGLILASFLIGIFLALNVGLEALLIGLTGLFLGYYYTAPPLRLVARKGLGELAITLAFGPLITLGVGFVLTQQLSAGAFLVGLPLGLLTANILLINQFPDAEADATTGKNHLVVTYGKEASTWIYFAILTGAFVSNLAIWNYLMPENYVFLAVAFVSYAAGLGVWTKIRQYYKSRKLVKQNVNTIMLSALTGLGMAIAIWLG
jgi:1,4-dihydroxy-2-naphthoate octaprenyltransferase